MMSNTILLNEDVHLPRIPAHVSSRLLVQSSESSNNLLAACSHPSDEHLLFQFHRIRSASKADLIKCRRFPS